MNDRQRNEGEAIQPASKRRVHLLCCVECGSQSGLHARGWRGYRLDDAGNGLPPTLIFFCPLCANRIFD